MTAWRVQLKARVNDRALAVVTRQFSVLIRAGVPILRALEILERQEKPGPLREALSEARSAVFAGSPLSAALRRRPEVFRGFYASLVRAGEVAGNLEGVLARVAHLLERTAATRSRLRAALVYPALVLSTAAVVLLALLIFVIPRFRILFQDLLGGAELPVLTAFVLGLSAVVQQAGLWLAPVAAIILSAGLLVSRRFFGGEWRRRLLRGMPVLGGLISRGAVLSFVRTLATLLTSGVPLMQALAVARESLDDPGLVGEVDQLSRRIEQGEPLSSYLAVSRRLPPLLASLVEVGECSGNVPEMLHFAADLLEEELEARVNAVLRAVEPALTVGLAGAVGAVVVALFLPIVSIIDRLG